MHYSISNLRIQVNLALVFSTNTKLNNAGMLQLWKCSGLFSLTFLKLPNEPDFYIFHTRNFILSHLQGQDIALNFLDDREFIWKIEIAAEHGSRSTVWCIK